MKNQMNEISLMDEKEGIVLFYPHVPKQAIKEVGQVLASRWIGQGPQVSAFEKKFTERFAGQGSALAVGAGTDALHLAYILAGLKQGDEVISPVFTCTATNIPFLYMGIKIRFADVDPKTLNINVSHVKQLINDKTKAIVCVHYGGLPCDMDELHALAHSYGIPVIEDAAHAPGATYKNQPIGSISPFTAFSFHAVKHLTTGDGGMLIVQDHNLIPKGERIRWFGIDRRNKQKGIWENDITEIGFKYQMTDIAATMGICALNEFSETLTFRQHLFEEYKKQLKNIDGITLVDTHETDRTHAAWILTVLVERRVDLMKWLREHKIESAQVHYRNDRYSVLGGRQKNLPNMDAVEDQYIVLPLHLKMTLDDVQFIADVIRKGW